MLGSQLATAWRPSDTFGRGKPSSLDAKKTQHHPTPKYRFIFQCTERLRTPKILWIILRILSQFFLLNGLKLPSDSFRILRHFLKASGKQLATHHFEGAKLMDFPWSFAEANPWITNPIPKKMIVKMGILPK